MQKEVFREARCEEGEEMTSPRASFMTSIDRIAGDQSQPYRGHAGIPHTINMGVSENMGP